MDIEWRSQLGQDAFVMQALGMKRNGIYVDIGAGDPKTISNTHVMHDLFGWNGIVCDIAHADALAAARPNDLVVRDALSADWGMMLPIYARDGWIDYLSLDLEPPDLALDVLRMLPLGKVRFRVATIEHDAHRINGHRRLVEMATIMYARGYRFVGTAGLEKEGKRHDVEDWWVHEDAVIPESLAMASACRATGLAREDG